MDAAWVDDLAHRVDAVAEYDLELGQAERRRALVPANPDSPPRDRQAEPTSRLSVESFAQCL